MPNPPKTKKGAWSNSEKEFIRSNYESMTVEEMAAKLNRDVATLQRWLEANLAPDPVVAEKGTVEKESIRATLRKSHAWAKLKDEFTTDELAYYEEEYIELFHQFQCDVFKTEEQQIRKAITLDILMRRNLAARKKLLGDIGRMEEWQQQAARNYKRDKDGLDQQERQQREEFLLNLETQLHSLRAAEQSKTKEFSDLDNRHQKLMEALKATREQRISRVESSKQSWLGLLRELADQERAQQVGQEMELMREATGREHKRLAANHVYDDGAEDQPILSAETVSGDEVAEEDDE